jgi:hypothetical protein
MVEAVRLFYRLDSCKSDSYYLQLQLVNRDSVITSLDEILTIAEEMHRLAVEGRETYKKAFTDSEKKNNLLKWYLRSSILATVIIIIISL